MALPPPSGCSGGLINSENASYTFSPSNLIDATGGSGSYEYIVESQSNTITWSGGITNLNVTVQTPSASQSTLTFSYGGEATITASGVITHTVTVRDSANTSNSTTINVDCAFEINWTCDDPD